MNTLTIHQAFGSLARLGAIEWTSTGYIFPTPDGLQITFSFDFNDVGYPDQAHSFVISDGSTVLAEAECSIFISSLRAAIDNNPQAVLDIIFGNVTTIVLDEAADADLSTVTAGLTLTGNDLGTLFTVTHAATVMAGEGDDTIVAQPEIVGGSIDGGGGDDTLSFRDAQFHVNVIVGSKVVDLHDANDANSATWDVEGIEFYRGSAFDDNFRANSEGMRFEGGAGLDNFYEGPSGGVRDVIDYSAEGVGRGIAVNFGADIYSGDTAGLPDDFGTLVTTLLDGELVLPGYNTILDTFGERDAVFGFQSFVIVGTACADFFYGSSYADWFDGGGGGDRFFGGDGDDTIVGGAGDDAIYFSLDRDCYTVTYDHGVLTLLGGGFTDTVSGVETFWFGTEHVDASELIPNTAPVAEDDDNASDGVVEATSSVAGDATASGNVLANDDDAEGDALSVDGAHAGETGSFTTVSGATVIAGKYGSLTIADDGTWSYALDDTDPDTNALQVGTTAHDVFTYRINDGLLGDEATLTISIAGSNDGTAGGADAFTTDEDAAVSSDKSTLTANDIDPEGETITLISVQGASHGIVALVGSNVVFTPNAGFHGSASFTYTAEYQLGGTLTRQVDVTVNSVADAPTAVDKTATIGEDGSFTFAASDFGFADQDVGDTLQAVVIVSLPGGGTLALSDVAVTAGQSVSVGQLSHLVFTPHANAHGSPLASFGFKVSDGALLSSQHSFAINVTATNDAPVANTDLLVAGPYFEDTAISLDPSALTANDTDVDGDPLTILSVGTAQHGTVRIEAGLVVFRPDANYVGAASFAYAVSDGSLTSNQATVSLNILAMPDAPSGADKTVTIAEDGSYSFLVSDFAFSDPDAGDALQAVVIVSLPGGGGLTLGGVAVAAGQSIGVGQLGQLVFTPAANANGSPLASFAFKVSDGGLESAAKTFTINVTASADAPTGTSKTITIAEDGSYAFAGLDFGFSDADVGDTLQAVRIVSLPSGGGLTLSGVAVAAGQSIGVGQLSQLVFTPAANANGSPLASFGFTVSDGALESAVKTISLNVTAINDAPTSTDKTVTIAEDGSYSFSAADFAFSDPDAGDALQAVVVASLPGAGTLTLGGVAVTVGQSIGVGQLAQLVFTPAENANGSPLASFGFRVSDGTLLSAQRTLTLNVTPSNDAPVAHDDAVSGGVEDTPTTLTAASLLGNDTDPDAGATLRIASVANGAGGTAVLNPDGTVTFTPLPNFNGTATFSYRVTDGELLSESATVRLAVAAVNDVPLVGGLSSAISVAENNTAVGVVTATDVEGDALTYVVSGDDGAMFEMSSGGVLRFKVAPDFEAATDEDHDNAYEVSVLVTGGSTSTVVSTLVTVMDADGVAITGDGKKNTIDKSHPFKGVVPGGEEDFIDGRKGNDKLKGEGGNDILIGGAGKDTLTGGTGADHFEFRSTFAVSGVDKITDFEHGADKIDLDDAIFVTLHGRLKPGQFFAADGAIAAHDRNDRVIYDSQTGRLFYDDDGNKLGGHDAVLFATLSTKPQLDVSDFVIA